MYAAMCARKSRVQLASKRLISAWLGLGKGKGLGVGFGFGFGFGLGLGLG